MRTLKLLTVLTVLAVLIGCRSQNNVIPPEPVVLNNSHNTTTRIVERVRIDTVRVEVKIPTERTEVRGVRDTVSMVEPSLAVSYAWVHSDGTLSHLIENKEDAALTADVPVENKESSVEVGDTIRSEEPVYIPQPYEVEKKLSAWQQFRLSAFWWLVGVMTLIIGYKFRKKLIGLIIRRL